MHELCEAFQATCDSYEKCFIVIDALDECNNQIHRKEIVRVLKILSTGKVRLFVTSRPHPRDIREYFENALRITIEASEADIKSYCSRMIKENPNVAEIMDEALRERVASSIASKADGM